MPRPKIPHPPATQDADRVAAAMRRLAEIACAEDANLYERLGEWPPEFQPSASNLVHAVINPISYGCALAMRELTAHLAILIGPAEAQAVAQAAVDEQRANPKVRANLDRLAGLEAKAQAKARAKAQATARAAAGPSPSQAVH